MKTPPIEASLLTPPGRGAIAVIEVRGANAPRLLDQGFAPAGAKRLSDSPHGAIRFGRWLGPTGEELVALRTANDRMEIHCHGGAAASRAILRWLVGRGAVIVDSLPARGLSPLAHSAWKSLPHATTERPAAVLLDQAQGALDRAIGTAIEAVRDDRSAEALAIIERLLSHKRLATRLIAPWRVVLAGPPNAGKSSLMNMLVGFERSIVYDQPGTTRDVVTLATAIGGWPATLADTAGLRVADDPIEAAGVCLARDTLAEADVVVAVQETARHGSAASVRLLEDLAASTPAPIVPVASKADLLEGPPPEGAIATSTVDRSGVDELLGAIESALGVLAPPPGAACPFADHHVALLADAQAALECGEAQRASLALHALLAGEDTVFDASRQRDCAD